MDEYLEDLIRRMTFKEENALSSDESVSFAAYREAEKLDTVDFLPQLQKYVENNLQKGKKAQRNACYFIMFKLLGVRPDQKYVEFLLAQLMRETDKYVISNMLDRIAELEIPEQVNIESIIQCTKNDKWQIRHSAIRALQSSDSDIARSTAIAILQTADHSKDEHEIVYAIAALNHIGKEEDIHNIRQFLSSKKRDIRVSAEVAIEEIKKRPF